MAEEEKPLPSGIPFAFALGICIVLSLVSNMLYGRDIGNTSCRYRLPYSPSSPAFAIWGVIYFGSFATIFAQYISYAVQYTPLAVDHSMFARDATNLLHALAWLCAAVWTPVFTTDTKVGFVVAALLLQATATCATSAARVENAWMGEKPEERRRWFIAAPCSLLGGWTITASAISIGIAARAIDDTPDEACERIDATEDDPRSNYSLWKGPRVRSKTSVPLLLAIAVAMVSLWLGDPIFPLPVINGVYWQKRTYSNMAAVCVLASASAATFTRAYTRWW